MSKSDQQLAELISDESFVRWIKGTASTREQQRWDSWEKEDPAHRELKTKAEMFYQVPLEMDAADDLEMQLDSLNQRIDEAEAENEKDVTPLPNKKPKRSLGGYRLAVAAAITLLLSVISVLYLYYPVNSPVEKTEPLFTTIEVGYGETSSLKFSDGSNIRLNAKSSLRYQLEQFNSDRVEVWLEGEGYFNITHDPGGQKREFIVHTPEGDVQVLGTKFNVNTRFQKTSVVLEEGSVGVSLKDTLKQAVDEKIMVPGERAILAQSSPDIVMQKVDVGMFTAWLDGEMEFNDTSLRDIINSIEATYGIILNVEDTKLLNQKITGRIQNPDLKNLLTGLQKILDLKIEQTNRKQFMITRQSIQGE
ncbi:FecR domain-containing protein [Aliifodinibius sp. S!AR15-10]|uniref:FecR family protein n=1 Tax=Aliifodinibius sp. S!AR15-10 TaxID=2950437 RepID=UPI002858B6BB|nr:FecR domain-containing protein [Aliifodinibius sp. S!AR15-10]MDR8392780.1 FecR domain-containing protein [Aliifodinibius sp. S!AR15-10]